jgi:hypothetical protein
MTQCPWCGYEPPTKSQIKWKRTKHTKSKNAQGKLAAPFRHWDASIYKDAAGWHAEWTLCGGPGVNDSDGYADALSREQDAKAIVAAIVAAFGG